MEVREDKHSLRTGSYELPKIMVGLVRAGDISVRSDKQLHHANRRLLTVQVIRTDGCARELDAADGFLHAPPYPGVRLSGEVRISACRYDIQVWDVIAHLVLRVVCGNVHVIRALLRIVNP